MNSYPHVIVVNNPLKSLKITSPITAAVTNIKVLLPDSYFDLKTGLWNISLDYVIVKGPLERILSKTVYEVKTALVTSVAFKNGLTEYCVPKAQCTSIGLFEVNLKEKNSKSMYSYKKFTPQWYFIDQPNLDHFELQIIESEFLPLTAPNKFEIELGLLFQRIR
jgi:hypothetical protein